MATERKDRNARLDKTMEQAAAWLAGFDAGTADETAFEVWRKADPRHAAAFAQVAVTWNRLNRLRERPEPARKMRKAPGFDSVVPGRKTLARPPRREFLRAAACGALTVGLGAFLAPKVFARQSATTETGERRTVALDDGSQIELNTDTAISWQIDSVSRRLRLKRGEVALTVTADPARPFLLNADKTMVQLSAGRFNMRLGPSGLEVLVLHGRAATAGDAPDGSPRAASVGTSQSLQVSRSGTRCRAVTEREIRTRQAWQHGEIIFAGTPLSAAVAEYNRYLRTKLVIRDPALSSIRLGGRFVTADPRDFLAALQDGFGIRAQDADSVIVLTR